MSAKIVNLITIRTPINFITIGAWGLMLGHGYRSHYSENALSSTLTIWITFIAIVLSEYNAAFLCHCFFYIFNDMAADMQIWALHTRSQCRVSDTQMTVKALGPLVIFSRRFCIYQPFLVENVLKWIRQTEGPYPSSRQIMILEHVHVLLYHNILNYSLQNLRNITDPTCKESCGTKDPIWREG